VSHDYPHHGRVLHEIQLAIASGETVALLGRSGCGKSTLARMLVGLETPQHGDIAWRGTPLTALKGEAIGAFRRDIQLVFQDAFSAVNPRKTVREIVSEPLRHLLRLSREERARRVEEMLQAVDLPRRCSINARRSSAADSCSASAWLAPWRYGRSC
jgi:nickel transport system ATP-binding protein